MRHLTGTTLLAAMILVGCPALPTAAQERAQERAASLRDQLVEVQAKEAELQAELQQTQEELKPANIESNLAGVGSTHPEELREQRRRQLDIEKNGLQSQLDVLAASRTRLEAAIARADAETYQQSAGVGANTATSQAEANKTATVTRKARRPRKHRVRRRSSILQPSIHE